MLHLIQGPAGGGKSQVVRDLVAAGTVQVVADVTRTWAAVGGYERDEDGKYPVREDDDPALFIARYLQVVTVRQALQADVDVAVTASSRGQAAKWIEIADETGKRTLIRTVDPGEATVRRRLADVFGSPLSAECDRAVRRWYEGGS
ncbi:MAG: AAA family ATPase [Gammaproteobacteria bacterium]|nr:AAA family ATPase [Gammaproteobacteria bacterium]MYC99463.1 ATP-binding protein [Gammaproteobacteria bacterium]